MADEITPALTPEQWAARLYRPGGRDGDLIDATGGSIGIDSHGGEMAFVSTPTARHALAALALHGQPFGFRWEDVRLLRAEADDARDGQYPDRADAFDDLADRISALLPPETQG